MSYQLFISNSFLSITIFSILYWTGVGILILALNKYHHLKEKPISYEEGLVNDPILKENLNIVPRLIRRYIFIFLASLALLYFIQSLSSHGFAKNQIFYGIFFFFALNTLIKGIRLYCTFVFLSKKGAVTGNIHYSSWMIFRLGALEESTFFLLYLTSFILSNNDIFWGGAFISFLLAIRNLLVSDKKQIKKSS